VVGVSMVEVRVGLTGLTSVAVGRWRVAWTGKS
jgi:hypothetical protein